MPEPSAPPQPQTPRRKPSRFWLFAPYAALLIAALGWTAYWWAASGRLQHAVIEEAKALEKEGGSAGWSSIKVDGYPFRFRVVLISPKFEDSAGWAIGAPRLEAMALAYATDRWVLAAPQGLVYSLGGRGQVEVTGKAIRASIGGVDTARPRFSFEGDKLVLTPAQGAAPPAFAAIDKLELHMQPGPNDQAALLINLDGGTLRPEAGLAKMAAGKPLSLVWDTRLTRVGALRGSNWPGALQAWRNAGGSQTVADMQLGIGGLSFKGQGGPLSVDPDGRLKGELPLKLDTSQTPNPALLQALGLLGPVPLRFQDGRASIGPMPIGAALKIG